MGRESAVEALLAEAAPGRLVLEMRVEISHDSHLAWNMGITGNGHRSIQASRGREV